MAVTRVYDPVFGWIVVPARRWNGTAWVADQRPKVHTGTSWVPMNGCAVRVVGVGSLSFTGEIPAGAQINFQGTGTLSFTGQPIVTSPCVASGIYIEDGSAVLVMEDASDCLFMEDA